MRLSKLQAGFAIAALIMASGCAAVWRPPIPPLETQDVFPPDQVARGAELAAIGDCVVCHTADGGRSYAGGRGVPTPFGTVYATNITPDRETGIGQWPKAAFQRAMRDGVDRAGRHLYPVLPYPHFIKATDPDIDALYAFLMTRAPVHETSPPNRLAFPLNYRVLLAGWNLLYLKPGSWHPDTAHDATWNRGAYLVEAIGHCGACHTPHNFLGAEKAAQSLAGGQAESWYAPPLQFDSPARQPWTEDGLVSYLRTGLDAKHGAAAGPMTAVTEQLAAVPEADLRAMAVYITSIMLKAGLPEAGLARMAEPKGAGAGPAHDAGQAHDAEQAGAIFTGACGGCHGADAPMTRDGAPPLSVGTAINAPTPRGVIQIILHGLPWRDGKPAPYMPAFASALTDAQVAVLAAYLRATYSDQPAWSNIQAEVARIRETS